MSECVCRLQATDADDAHCAGLAEGGLTAGDGVYGVTVACDDGRVVCELCVLPTDEMKKWRSRSRGGQQAFPMAVALHSCKTACFFGEVILYPI